jgi:H/ACA ribonucleoprotein complex subunit 2
VTVLLHFSQLCSSLYLPLDLRQQESVLLETAATMTERPTNISVIAQPLAGAKLTKRLYKLVKRAAKEKSVRRGVKEVVKALRKGEKGLCVIAGDISPIDVITHVPVLCEEAGVPYVYVPSKEDLGTASLTKRPTSCVLIIKNDKIKDRFEKCYNEVHSAVRSRRNELDFGNREQRL